MRKDRRERQAGLKSGVYAMPEGSAEHRSKDRPLHVLLSALLPNLGGEFRNAGSVQFAGSCQVQQFMLGQNAAEKEVEEGAIAASEGADDIDALVPHRLDNSTNVFEAAREAKDHRDILSSI